MNEGEALFRAICEQPWEDTPRLVYADWLDENGDPLRAEFIRVQVALARETNRANERVPELRARAEELRRQSNGRWTRGSPTQLGVRIESGFSRGFYHRVTFDGYSAFADCADQVFGWTPIDALTVRFAEESLAALLHSPYLRRLSALSLPGRLGDGACRLLADCSALERLAELSVSGDVVDEPGARALIASPHLGNVRRLNLGSLYHLSKSTRALLKKRFKDVHSS